MQALQKLFIVALRERRLAVQVVMGRARRRLLARTRLVFLELNPP